MKREHERERERLDLKVMQKKVLLKMMEKKKERERERERRYKIVANTINRNTPYLNRSNKKYSRWTTQFDYKTNKYRYNYSINIT